MKRLTIFLAIAACVVTASHATAQDTSQDAVPTVDYSVPADPPPPDATDITTAPPLTLNQGEDDPVDPEETTPGMPIYGSDGFTTGTGSDLVPGFTDDINTGSTEAWPPNAPVDDIGDGDGSGVYLPPGIEGVMGGDPVWRPDPTMEPPVYGGWEEYPPDDEQESATATTTTTVDDDDADAYRTDPAPPVTASTVGDITTTTDLGCGGAGFFEGAACATEIASGPYLFGPENIPGGNNPGGFYPVSQTVDGDAITTIVDTAAYHLRVTQTDQMDSAAGAYTTTIRITNNGTQARRIVVYRGGDCYTANNDNGYGAVGDDGSVACVSPGGLAERWTPLTAGSNYLEARYADLWAAMNTGAPFPDTCACSTLTDNAAGLSWAATVPAGGTITVAHRTTIG